jgi:hypothetical protein
MSQSYEFMMIPRQLAVGVNVFITCCTVWYRSRLPVASKLVGLFITAIRTRNIAIEK